MKLELGFIEIKDIQVHRTILPDANIESTYARMARIRANAKIEQDTAEMKLKFFTNISHELRTPLTLIMGGIEEVQRRETLSERGESSLNLSYKNSKRMLSLINQILDFRKVVKNKIAPPFKEAEFDIMYGEGISKIGELVDMGLKFGFVQKSGAWFYLGEERLGQGRDAAKQYFKDHPDVADRVEAQIVAKLTGKDESKKDDLADMRAPAPTAKAKTASRGSVEVFADDFEDDD